MGNFESLFGGGNKKLTDGFCGIFERDETKMPEVAITERTKEMIGRQHKNREIRVAKKLIGRLVTMISFKPSLAVLISK